MNFLIRCLAILNLSGLLIDNLTTIVTNFYSTINLIQFNGVNRDISLSYFLDPHSYYK